MPQYRKLYVKSVESLDINELPDDFTRLLWVLLPLGLDREGRGFDHPGWVKSKLMPLRDDIAPDMIRGALDTFAGRGMIVRYEVQGRKYFYVPTFLKYQGDTKRETESLIPPPPDTDLLTTNSGPTQELVVSKSGSDSDSDSYTDLDSYARTRENDFSEAPESMQPPQTEIDSMAEMVTELTGYPPNSQADRDAIRVMTGLKITESDIRAALDFFKSKNKTARGAAGILESAKFHRVQRIQAANARASPGPPGANGKSGVNVDQLRSEGWEIL